jgi:hypothetical protein
MQCLVELLGWLVAWAFIRCRSYRDMRGREENIVMDGLSWRLNVNDFKIMMLGFEVGNLKRGKRTHLRYKHSQWAFDVNTGSRARGMYAR